MSYPPAVPLATLPAPLEVMIEAALAGAREVMAVYAGDFAVETKADGSPVSEADRRAERAILAQLAEHFPGIPVVAEESVAEDGDSLAQDSGTGRFFLVDPLDGTREFISRNGEFTVNVALVEAGRPVAGVVMAPALTLGYAGVAMPGAPPGAWKCDLIPEMSGTRDWHPIAARTSPAPPVAVASRSHSTAGTEALLARLGVAERRSIGSSLKFCLVAEGAADLYPRLGPTNQWDTAAGDAVLRAAGGAVIGLGGDPLPYGRGTGINPFLNPHYLAYGDPALHARLVAAA